MTDNINGVKRLNMKNVKVLYHKGLNMVKAKFCDNENYIILTYDQFKKLESIKQIFHFKNSDKYPYFKKNYKNVSILTFLYEHSFDDLVYKFKNGNKFDIRPTNIVINNHKYYDNIKDEYDIIGFINGHAKTNGGHAYIIKNPIWITSDGLYIMACDKNKHTVMCEKSYDKMIEYAETINYNPTYYVNNDGYVVSSDKVYLHQIITGLFYSGKGTGGLSVDHIDRDRTNNQFDNLRVVEFEVQHRNAKEMIEGIKRKRKKNAQPLPKGITQDMMNKYITYNKEDIKDKDGNIKYTRKFYRVEKHPKLTKKCWSTSKSMKVTIQAKLEQAINKLYELDNDIVNTSYKLPKYVRKIVKNNGKVQIIYERRINGQRQEMRQTINNYDENKLKEYADNFMKKVKEKYP